MSGVRNGEAIRVLLVEDDNENRQTIAASLNKCGVFVSAFADAASALEAFDETQFDAVVADIRLGTVNGLQLLESIRKRTLDFPVILITAYGDADYAITALRLGAQDFILKPFDSIQSLLHPLEHAVHKYRLLLKNRALERKLMESEARCREFAELLPETVFEANMDGIVQFANIAGLRKFGRSIAELSAGQISIFDHVVENDVLRLRETIARLFRGEKVSGAVFIAKAKDGTQFHVMTFFTAIIGGGQPVGMRSIVVDISGQRKDEAKIRALTSDLLLAGERERWKLSMSLHESVGQVVAAAEMHLTVLAERLNAASDKQQVQQVMDLFRGVLRDVLSIGNQLCPPVLYAFGLEQALENLAHSAGELYGIPTTFSSDGRKKHLTDDATFAIFRVIQELMTNIASHSGMSNAEISVRRDGTRIVVTVSGEGVYKNGRKLKEDEIADSLGLARMRERLEAIAGDALISASGHNVRITVSAPLKEVRTRIV